MRETCATTAPTSSARRRVSSASAAAAPRSNSALYRPGSVGNSRGRDRSASYTVKPALLGLLLLTACGLCQAQGAEDQGLPLVGDPIRARCDSAVAGCDFDV